MVNAILEGRKTQTRRVIKPQPDIDESYAHLANNAWQSGFVDIKCPYGKVGDKFPLREDAILPRHFPDIELEITNIRVERLNDISESDCEKEGALDDGFIAALNANADEGYPIDQTIDLDESAKNQFIELWESINGKGSWEQNPWVWVVEFKHLTNPPRLKDY